MGTVIAALVAGVAGGALIAVGPGVASCGGAAPGDLTTERGRSATSTGLTQLQLRHPACGHHRGDRWSVASGRQGSDAARIRADSGSLEVESSQNDEWWFGGRQHWIVGLPAATTYRLDVTANAADTTIDLGGSQYTTVTLQPNAGSLTLDLTEAQVELLQLSLNAGSAAVMIGPGMAMDGVLSVNAGAIDLCIADGVALSVTTSSNITFSHNLDESDLRQVGDTWSTAGYAEATDRVEIQLDGNAGSFTLNPEGGCS